MVNLFPFDTSSHRKDVLSVKWLDLIPYYLIYGHPFGGHEA